MGLNIFRQNSACCILFKNPSLTTDPLYTDLNNESAYDWKIFEFPCLFFANYRGLRNATYVCYNYIRFYFSWMHLDTHYKKSTFHLLNLCLISRDCVQPLFKSPGSCLHCLESGSDVVTIWASLMSRNLSIMLRSCGWMHAVFWIILIRDLNSKEKARITCQRTGFTWFIALFFSVIREYPTHTVSKQSLRKHIPLV